MKYWYITYSRVNNFSCVGIGETPVDVLQEQIKQSGVVVTLIYSYELTEVQYEHYKKTLYF